MSAKEQRKKPKASCDPILVYKAQSVSKITI